MSGSIVSIFKVTNIIENFNKTKMDQLRMKAVFKGTFCTKISHRHTWEVIRAQSDLFDQIR